MAATGHFRPPRPLEYIERWLSLACQLPHASGSLWGQPCGKCKSCKFEAPDSQCGNSSHPPCGSCHGSDWALQAASTPGVHREVAVAGMPAPTCQWQFVEQALRESQALREVQVLQVQSAELPMWQQQPSSLWELPWQRLGNFRSARPPGGIERCQSLACQIRHGSSNRWGKSCEFKALNGQYGNSSHPRCGRCHGRLRNCR